MDRAVGLSVGTISSLEQKATLGLEGASHRFTACIGRGKAKLAILVRQQLAELVARRLALGA